MRLLQPTQQLYVFNFRESSDYKLQEECVDFLTNKCGITEFNANDIHRALGIFKSNSCSISGFRARALFPTFSLINHSCLRNARHLINSEQRLMQIVAQADIKAGQEINVRSAINGCWNDFIDIGLLSGTLVMCWRPGLRGETQSTQHGISNVDV